ncbi:hypothetical protein SGLAM104S_08665 [Streptomyces glaucescens]
MGNRASGRRRGGVGRTVANDEDGVAVVIERLLAEGGHAAPGQGNRRLG